MTQNAINNNAGAFSCTSNTIDPGASGDSFVQFNINTTGEFRIGVDDDASDAFKISQGSALGTNDTFIMTAAGENTKPLQPAFSAYESTGSPNVTGNNTAYFLGNTDVGSALTEIFDQGSDFTPGASGGAIFTAPVTGRYAFFMGIRAADITGSATSWVMKFDTSNRGYDYVINPASIDSAADLALGYSTFADMDAMDTCKFRFTVNGEGADTVDVSGSNADTFVAGYLVC